MKKILFLLVSVAISALAQVPSDTTEVRIKHEVSNDISAEAYAEILKKLAADTTLKVLNTALRFDGENDVVNCGDVEGLKKVSELTIEMWVNIEKFSQWRTFFAKRIHNFDRIQFQEFSNPGDIGIAVSKKGVLGYYHTTDQPVTIGDWFFLAMVFDGAEADNQERLKLYINGRRTAIIPIKGAEVPAVTSANNKPLLLGAERPDGAWGYAGTMDDVRIWKIARTTQQISEDMRGVKPENNDNVLAYYHFNENGGTLLNDVVGDANGRLDNFALQGTNSNWVIREYDAPSVAATGIQIVRVGPTTAKLMWTCGSGAYRDVFIREARIGAAVQPIKGTTYIPGAFSTGTQVGASGWFCVYNGSSCNTEVTGLDPETEYRAQVVEYNGVPGLESYAVVASPENPRNFTTLEEPMPSAPTVQADSLQPVTLEYTSAIIKWVRGNGDGCAVFVCRDSIAAPAPVEDRIRYTPHMQYGEGDSCGVWSCVYAGGGEICKIDSLEKGTTYRAVVYEYASRIGPKIVWLTSVSSGNIDTFTTPVPPLPVVVVPPPVVAAVPVVAATPTISPLLLYGSIASGVLLTTLLILIGPGGDDDVPPPADDIFDLGTPPVSPLMQGFK